MKLYIDLPREGPGGPASLSRALDGLRFDARIFDAACGSGADSALMLDTLPGAQIIGVDKHSAFIDAARARDLPADFRVADMLVVEGMFDLIWSAGAVYFVGLEAALTAWRNHLNPGGRVAFSEIVWLTDAPSNAPKAFWNAEFPQMGTIDSLSQRIKTAGFKVIDAHPIGRDEWTGYYGALTSRVAALRKGDVSAELAECLRETETEIALFYDYPGDYDYALFIAEPA